ncbi:MAG: hypothetical protein EXR53_05005 [Dehalococcoidia bacterium]|nr:hypothetical protein [Dehalococcoidia bacterium]
MKILLAFAVIALLLLMLVLLWIRGSFKSGPAAPAKGTSLFAEILPRAFIWGIGLALGFLVVELPLAILGGILAALLLS